MKHNWIGRIKSVHAFRPLQSMATKIGEVNADTTSFSIRASSVAGMRGENTEKKSDILRPLVVCGPSGVGKVM